MFSQWCYLACVFILFPYTYDFAGRQRNYWYLKEWKILRPKHWIKHYVVTGYVLCFAMAYYRPANMKRTFSLTASAAIFGRSCSAAYVGPGVQWGSRGVFLLPLLKQVPPLWLYSAHSLLLYWGFLHWLAMSSHTSLLSHYWQRVIDNFPWQEGRLGRKKLSLYLQ